MRLYEITLKEGYKEVKQKFLSSNKDEETINSYIKRFKDLVDRNQLQGNEKNIDYWGKQGFDSFKEMVDFKSQQKSKTQTKRSKVKGESITIYEDDDWLIVVPLDKDASCFHGKNTNWCTTKPTKPYFEEYFYDDQATLIYFIRKKDLNKWAIITFGNDTIIAKEYFDKNNNRIPVRKFNDQTGLNANKFIEMAKKKYNKIQPKRDKYKKYKQKIEDAIDRVKKGNHSYELEDSLLQIKNTYLIFEYMRQVGKSSKYNKGIQLLAVMNNGVSIRYIANPDKDVQLAAVKENLDAIKYISDPHPDVKKYAEKVRKNG